MSQIEKVKVCSGVYWIGIPAAKLYVLCGCPADSVKHLMKMGLIKTIEANGCSFETGPNAILLSDVLIQHGNFSNLAEFPVLQMLYRQGMLLPNHPNNTGEKPLLIGAKKQIKAQMEYIYRGNYGLTSEDELMEAGVSEKMAQEMMRLKLKFAFGKIRKTEELLDSIIVDQEPLEIKNGVIIRRTGINQYQFEYHGETADVDLNLQKDEEYDPPYELGYHQIKREYFSVVHSGEGDGWDINRPSMSGIIIFHGKIYLIDAGANILHSLTSLGISVNEIEGIFHTHAHDDHFCGLTTLIRSDHRIKHYTTPLIRASIVKKLSALLSWEKDNFSLYFDTYDLEMDVWNNIKGLEVKPTFSPHPVETNIFTFRALWENGYLTYGHFADISSFEVLKGMEKNDDEHDEVPPISLEHVKSEYLTPLNLKKLDIGGGLIHGQAEDFREDTSDKIILAHTALKLNAQQKEIGSNAPFGTVDVLIPANQDYTMRNASQLLRDYFLNIPVQEIRMLLNCEVINFNAGSILLKEGETNQNIFLILNGIVELIRSETSTQNMLSTGYMVGEMPGLMEVPSMETFRADSYVRALRIPATLYSEFVARNDLYHNIEKVVDTRDFLQNTSLFGEMVSYPIQNKIAQAITLEIIPEGEKMPACNKPGLIMLCKGRLSGHYQDQDITIETPGDFFGEESILFNKTGKCEIQASKKSRLYRIPRDLLTDIPVVLWKLLETLERRSKNF